MGQGGGYLGQEGVRLVSVVGGQALGVVEHGVRVPVLVAQPQRGQLQQQQQLLPQGRVVAVAYDDGGVDAGAAGVLDWMKGEGGGGGGGSFSALTQLANVDVQEAIQLFMSQRQQHQQHQQQQGGW